jgi:hypothetical protein
MYPARSAGKFAIGDAASLSAIVCELRAGGDGTAGAVCPAAPTMNKDAPSMGRTIVRQALNPEFDMAML